MFLPCRHSSTAVDIPDDVLQRISRFLSTKDVARNRAVCKTWANDPWASISLACEAHVRDRGQLQWFFSVTERYSSSLQSVQLHFRRIERWEGLTLMFHKPVKNDWAGFVSDCLDRLDIAQDPTLVIVFYCCPILANCSSVWPPSDMC